MKDKFIFFVIGLLLGAIISTSAFYVYSKSINTQMPMNNGNPPSISSDSSNDSNQPPDMPSNDSNQSNDQSSGGNNNSQPPEKPDDSNNQNMETTESESNN